MASQVILYDIPTKQGTSWSLNPWKTRMILNYKNIPYQTSWIEYPDIESTLKSFNIPPNSKDEFGYSGDYTCPAIKYSDGTYAMDSWLIARDLETSYPNPSLHFEDPIVEKIRRHIGKLRDPLIGHLIPKVPGVLNDTSVEYFCRTRAQHFGKSLKELGEEATDEGWEQAKEPAREVGDLLRKNDGPFFLGNTVSYADFIFVSFIQFFRRLDERLFEKFLTLDPTFSKVYEACEQWLQKDD